MAATLAHATTTAPYSDVIQYVDLITFAARLVNFLYATL